MDQFAMRISFVPLESSAPKFFGFAEFLAGLALMVLAWTIADVRYRFRIRSAPLPLQGLTFAIVAAIGTLTLLTDLWRAQSWLVPKLGFVTPASWQSFLAGLYFLTFLIWAVFAFIKPATFSRWNARRYTRALFQAIVKGSPSELAIVADELMRSAKPIVAYAAEPIRLPRFLPSRPEGTTKSEPQAYAENILSLIADRRFCRAVVESSPGTAWAFFYEMGESKKYGIPIQMFATNIMNEAIENTGSFLYHETAGYRSGLIGSYKPISQSIFSNYEMVETIGTVFHADFRRRSKWDSVQWEAYCRAVLMTFRDYIERGNLCHSNVLLEAIGDIKEISSELYKLNGTASPAWNNDLLERLRVVVDFTKEAVNILDKREVPTDVIKRRQGKKPVRLDSIYDAMADLIYEEILDASAVRSPRDLCWWVQHIALWGTLFNFGHLDGRAGKVVKAKVCRLLYDDIREMNSSPNFKGARILGYCLNVLGLEPNKQYYSKDSRALHRAILCWTRRNFARVHDFDPRVAEACLVDGVTYDAENCRVSKKYFQSPGQREEPCVYLNVDRSPAAAGKEGPKTTPRAKISAVKKPRNRRISK